MSLENHIKELLSKFKHHSQETWCYTFFLFLRNTPKCCNAWKRLLYKAFFCSYWDLLTSRKFLHPPFLIILRNLNSSLEYKNHKSWLNIKRFLQLCNFLLMFFPICSWFQIYLSHLGKELCDIIQIRCFSNATFGPTTNPK